MGTIAVPSLLLLLLLSVLSVTGERRGHTYIHTLLQLHISFPPR